MSTVSDPTKLLLTLSMLRGVGPATLKKVVAVPDFHSLSTEDLSVQVAPLAKACAEHDAWPRAVEEAQKQIDEASRVEARIISRLDPEYPRLLASTADDPLILFVRGRLWSAPERSVAIIGTREPTPHGELVAERITSFFVEQGWSIVSGLAIGCDAVAHRAALKCKGHTVAVLAHGLHMIAPTRHKKLADEILVGGGALVSEYRFGQDVQKQQYVKRDKTQAGLARGVVMIQSDVVGGSLHASRAALSYSRWLAVPYPTERDKLREEPKIQANLLIADGTDQDRMNLLRCSKSELDLLAIVRGKDDYRELLAPEGSFVSSLRPRHSETPSEKNDGSEQELAPTIKNHLERALARQRYITVRLRELDALVDCLADASVETKWELLFGLEEVLGQMRRSLSEAEGELRRAEALRTDWSTSARELVQEICELRNTLFHRGDIPLTGEASGQHVADSVQVRHVRTRFRELLASALQTLREKSTL